MSTAVRSFTVHDIEQRSAEWIAIRLGRVCGSRAADMLATNRSGGEAAGRRNLRTQLVLERITNRSHEKSFLSDAMRDGMDREACALDQYEALTGNLVSRVGYVLHTSIMAGVSPDGVIGDFEGLVECKSPIASTHLEYCETGVVPGEYLKQILHSLFITRAEWCDWMSFHPDFPPPLQTKLVRIKAKDVDLDGYQKALQLFLKEVDEKVASVKALMQKAKAVA
jgi:hypothetical protein